ncbi:poly(A) RNA polymerase, mitochondrial [Aulostomus maculatus]
MKKDERSGFKTFCAVQAERQEQAERSVLISCPSKMKEKTILKYLSKHGDVKMYFSYESLLKRAVVEFATRDSVASLMENAEIPNSSPDPVVPYKTRLLTLQSLSSNDASNQPSNRMDQLPTTLPIHRLIQTLSKEESIEQQITSLTETYQLTEENIRLRFLVCSLLKDVTSAFFPQSTIRPFGSSVNGFGKLGCDLDMLLDLGDIAQRNSETQKSGMSVVYQMKRVNSERIVTQKILSVIAECLNQFGPGCAGVQKILSARCPLVRFSHQPSGFLCDLTANNRVGMKSSELLYLYGELDPRVRHLVFSVRCWARAQGITSSISGAWISNFSLTVMVLFFLQRRNPPIIPTLDHLRDLADPTDKSMIEGNDCTFVSNLNKIQLQTNTETLEHLLCEFFEFYSTFGFKTSSINIRKGKEQNKPELGALHIQNPFETSLNVSKNVNTTQLDRFVALCKEGAWQLHQMERRKPKSGSADSASRPWGLATLLLPSQVARINTRIPKQSVQTSEHFKSLLDFLKTNTSQKSPTS